VPKNLSLKIGWQILTEILIDSAFCEVLEASCHVLQFYEHLRLLINLLDNGEKFFATNLISVARPMSPIVFLFSSSKTED
jgi:hypothetical protein